MTEQLHTHIRARTGHISLNRPKALNALTLPMIRDLWAAYKAAAADPSDGALRVLPDVFAGRAVPGLYDLE